MLASCDHTVAAGGKDPNFLKGMVAAGRRAETASVRTEPACHRSCIKNIPLSICMQALGRTPDKRQQGSPFSLIILGLHNAPCDAA